MEARIGREALRPRAAARRARRALVAAAGLLILAGTAGPAEELSLAETIATASWGTANGYLFDHLVSLDPANTYTGGAMIEDDTCIQGNGATIDLGGEYIFVLATTYNTRFDIDHALILNGGPGTGPFYGGGIEFGPGTQGWVINNTFHHNNPYGIYLHEVDLDEAAVRIELNILYRNGVAGIVINDNQLGSLEIGYNDSNGSTFDYAQHCACGSEEIVEIIPGEPLENPYIDGTNFRLYPGFVHDPADPHGGPADYHLAEGSPCIGAGPFGEDLGALPYVDTPVVMTTWGGVKSLFRE